MPAPLSLKALRGKVVLLDFWTYGCINCIHILPDLKKLEEQFPDELVVIGVHSAKFTNEKATENIRQIIRRYEIEHPVANDAEFRIWRAYTVRAWPSRVIIDPAGYVVGAASGEGNYEGFEQAIAAVIACSTSAARSTARPLALKLESEGVAETPLMFPGKVLATADRLFISDSNHHQIVVAGHDGARARSHRQRTARVRATALRRGRVPQAAGPGAGRRHAVGRRHREPPASRRGPDANAR